MFAFPWSCACAPKESDSEFIVQGASKSFDVQIEGQSDSSGETTLKKVASADSIKTTTSSTPSEGLSGNPSGSGSGSISESSPNDNENDDAAASSTEEEATLDSVDAPIALPVPDVRGMLSEEDLKTVQALEEELGPEAIKDLHKTLVAGEAVESCLLRFFRLNHDKIRPTAKTIRAHLTWWDTMRPDLLIKMTPGEASGMTDELVNNYMPTWHQGYSKDGHPVMFTHYGKFRTKPLHDAGVTADHILKLQVWNSERAARLCGEQSSKLNKDLWNSIVVIDTAGLDPQVAFHKISLELARGFTKIDQEHYPDRMHRLIVINAPSTVQYFYRMSAWIFPERERRRVQILADREQWKPVLLQLIDEDQLPECYGGTAEPVQN